MFRSRLRTHAVLAAVSFLFLSATTLVGNPGFATAVDRVSLVSAYMFLLLLCIVLLIGPLRAMRTGRVTVNHILRRDLAIWCALLGLVHLLAGAMQSMTPVYLSEFVTHASNQPSVAMREFFFLWSTIAGIVIGALLIVLLTLSNNWSMAWIGKRWWKRLHSMSYIVFVLTLVHGLGFQVLESRSWPGYAMVGIAAFVICIAQFRGIRAIRH